MLKLPGELIVILQKLYTKKRLRRGIESQAFSEFCDVEFNNHVPNGNILGLFRNLFICNGLQEKLFG